ncbi:MAG: hypothetical protein JST92_13060 [Deltaproteobacteria bacterium]|nr:hypothetical protein [Deltaproteobacteria bacterium]
MTARVARVELHDAGGPLPRELTNAHGGLLERRGLVLRLVDTDGALGLGEASPLPGFSKESLAEVRRELFALAPAQLPALEAAMGTRPHLVESLRRFVDASGVRHAASRCALELAALDLLGCRAQVPASVLLGAPPDARVEVCALLDGPREALLTQALALLERGHRTLKFKLGTRALADDVRALEQLSPLLRGRARLRLDANQSIPPRDLDKTLDALARFEPELIEEPSTPDALRALRTSPIPIALDESLASEAGPGLARRLADRRALEALVMKPTLLGGVTPCLALADLARELEVRVLVTHLWDGPIALAAADALALATAHQALPAGLAVHPALAAFDELVAAPPARSTISLTPKPGLGVTLRRPS